MESTIEVNRVYEDARYQADAFYDRRFPDALLIHVSATTGRHKLLFKACSVGLLFHCKRCEREHYLRWDYYNRFMQAAEPPYDVLCCAQAENTFVEIFLVRADEPLAIPYQEASRIYTITGEQIALIAAVALFLNNWQEAV